MNLNKLIKEKRNRVDIYIITVNVMAKSEDEKEREEKGEKEMMSWVGPRR